MIKNFLATEHIPAFVDTDDPPEQATFSNTNELLEIDWVKSYTEWPEFHNFCQHKDGRSLMIENEDGTWWWVVAKVTKGSLNLPIARMTTSRKN